MIAYKFTTQINEDGSIIIPDYLKKYYSNSVEVIMLFPEKKEDESNNISNFYNLIDEYNKIEEPELKINEIYKTRLNNNEREFDFS